ncbi:unnamed protein product [Linum tenue]|uniref:Uncharacterized protein n=1 Tax=Linum tenue TaxID=586396 RepID=A0AAV0NVE3_9ROSI|nr:unnamed protein product [Linum tenue]
MALRKGLLKRGKKSSAEGRKRIDYSHANTASLQIIATHFPLLSADPPSPLGLESTKRHWRTKVNGHISCS